MSKELLHIWGPFSIQSYGLFIVIGLAVAVWLFLRDPKRKALISHDDFSKVIVLAVFSAIIGGRILYLIEDSSSISSFWDIFKLWEGGLSSLGSIIAILLVIPPYLKHLKIPFIPFLDMAAIYAPMVEAIARFGCFSAGCCYGKETTLPWAITYTDSTTIAPLYKALHPAQLYSAAAAFAIFLLMKYLFANRINKPGQLVLSYIMLTSIARFSIDFFRGDQTFFKKTGIISLLSTSQWLSLLLCTTSFITIVIIQKFFKK